MRKHNDFGSGIGNVYFAPIGTYAVWPYPEPTENVKNWSVSDWSRYVNRFRPTDYDGPPDDTRAWNSYILNKESPLLGAYHFKRFSIEIH